MSVASTKTSNGLAREETNAMLEDHGMSWKLLDSRPMDLYPYCDHCNENLWPDWPTRVAYSEVLRDARRHFCSTDCRDAFRVICACLETTG